MRIALPLLCLALVSCASVRDMDRGYLSQFAMTGPGQWEMTASAAARGAHSEENEAKRRGWINDYIQANGCSTYEVTERRVTKAPPQRAMLGIKTDGDTIYYAGTCQ